VHLQLRHSHEAGVWFVMAVLRSVW
jgi:hypothetical protein